MLKRIWRTLFHVGKALQFRVMYLIKMLCLGTSEIIGLIPKKYLKSPLNEKDRISWKTSRHVLLLEKIWPSTPPPPFSLNFIYLFLAALSSRCCAQTFCNCGEQGYSLMVGMPLIVVASVLVKHRVCRLQQLQHVGSVVEALGLSCPTACGISPGAGINLCPCAGSQIPCWPPGKSDCAASDNAVLGTKLRPMLQSLRF